MPTPGLKKKYLQFVTLPPLLKQVEFDFYNDTNSNVFHFLIPSMISHLVK